MTSGVEVAISTSTLKKMGAKVRFPLYFIKNNISGIVLVFSLLISEISIADDKATLLSTQTPTDRLYDVEIIGRNGYAVGEAGLILKTSDGGKSWEKIESPTTLSLIKVAITENGAVAVGQLGEVIVTARSSKWEKGNSNTKARLLGVDMNSRGLTIAVGAFGELLRSKDGGKNWEDIRPDWAPLYDSGEGDTLVIRDEPTNYVVKVFEDDRVIIGGEYGQLLTSYDGGDTWSLTYRHPQVGSLIAPTLFDIKFYDGIALATGQSGLVLISRDDGASWKATDTPTAGSLFAIAGDKSGKIFAIGQRVSVVSTDHGVTWDKFDTLDISLNWYAGLARIPEQDFNSLIAVGFSGRILSLRPFQSVNM